ncbi:MAG: hypothetical protein KDG50_14100 [Chromatiales bacterium]|nr:hypothetical protein [Chromatiales bacterium]
MGWPRQNLIPIDGPALSLALPPALLLATPDEANHPPSPPAGASWLGIVLSAYTDAVISIGARPARGLSSVRAFLQTHASSRGSSPGSTVEVRFGGTRYGHAGLALDFGTAGYLAAFEDGGWLLSFEVACPARDWNDYGSFLLDVVRSAELLEPAGPSLSLDGGAVPPLQPGQPDPEDQRLAEESSSVDSARTQAATLIAAGRWDDAEALIVNLTVPNDPGAILGQLYEQALSAIAEGSGDPADAPILFERALRWQRVAYPDPHTAIEAEDFEHGKAADETRLRALLNRLNGTHAE